MNNLYVKGSETSEAAAVAIEPHLGKLQKVVFGYLVTRGPAGATDEEIQTAMKMGPSTERPRRVELVDRGLVKDSGRTRPTAAGRRAAVWVLSDMQLPLFL
jgi:hypothetical protein